MPEQMPPTASLQIALQAVRELGFEPVALNALYKLGLKTGYFRLTEKRNKKKEDHPSSFISPLFHFPTREALLATLGPPGLEQLAAGADEIVGGQFRQFACASAASTGGDPVKIQLAPPGILHHWTAYETRPNLHPATFDIKLIWEPARFGWAFTLGRAYHLTGDERYPEAFWRYFEQFSAANPPNMGPNWMSGQEVGIRLMGFVWASQAFSGSQHSTPARLAGLAVSTAEHAARIPATLLYARSQNNNHLLTEAAALYTAGLALPHHPDAAKWHSLGQKWLAWCLEHQIDSRGEYVQHSTNYHRLMLQTALWVQSLKLKVEGSSQQPSTLTLQTSNLALATHWLLSLLDFDSGGVPNLGANDGAYLFPLTNQPISDYRPVASAAARAFLYATLPPGPWDEMSLWLGLERTPDHSEITRYPGDHIYAEESWGMLRAVKYTSRPSHADQLHLDLWWRGLNIARDAGTYHYNAAPPWDNPLTSTLVHNTVSVDGAEQMTRVSRFLYLNWANATSKQHFETDGDFLQRFSATTDAYQTRFGVRHERRVTLYPNERWMVHDTLTHASPQAHTFRLHWLLPDWEWAMEEKGDKGITLRLKSPHGWLTVQIHLQPSNLHPSTTLVRAGDVVWGDLANCPPTRGWLSPTYSVKNPALSLAVEVQSANTIEFTTEFLFPHPHTANLQKIQGKNG